jgi:nucleotide-binding universal stress UspA family protein
VIERAPLEDGDISASEPSPLFIQHVVVPTNGFPPNERALPVADALAAQLRADVEVVSMLFDASHQPERLRLLSRLGARLKGANRQVRTSTSTGTDPSAFVLDLIRRDNTVVVIAGGTTVLGLPGSTTSDVVRFASAPTMFVGPKVVHWSGPVQRIVVPLDGSAAAAAAAVPIALAWARELDARIELIQVVTPQAAERLEALEEHLVDSGYLESVAHEIGNRLSTPIEFEVLHASTHDRAARIAERAAEQDGSIICMASNGSRHSHSLVASTTLRVIHLAEVPVLVCRS